MIELSTAYQITKYKKVRAFQAFFQILNLKKLLLCWKCQPTCFLKGENNGSHK